VKKMVSVPRIKRKIKKFLKSKWTKTVLLSIVVFMAFTFLTSLVSFIIVVNRVSDIMLLFKASILINIIIYPLWFLECLRVIEKYEIKRKAKRNKRRYEETP